MFKRTCISIILLLSVFGSVWAERLDDNQIWTDYYLYQSVLNSSKFVHRLGTRYHLPESNTKYLVHYRPSFRFKIGQFEPQVGTALFFQEAKHDASNLELRPWLGVQHKWAFSSPFSLVNLLRMEYRLTNSISNNVLEDNTRLRYKFGLNGTIYRDQDVRKVYGMMNAESFWNLADLDRFDYNLLRLNTGVGATVSTHFRIEFIYTKQLVQSGVLQLSETYSNLFQVKLRHQL